MRVFKFGGASVKDAKGVKNIAGIVANSSGSLVVVVSAMGKMTNAFEMLVKLYVQGNEEKWEQLKKIKDYHFSIIADLFQSTDNIYNDINSLFSFIEERMHRHPSLNYDFEYDQIVAYGEILSTKIVSAWLNKAGINNKWTDIRFLLKTSDKWREADVNWELSTKLVQEAFDFSGTRIYLTQGFIGATNSDLTTTLGREGSDYTAAIIANILMAERVEVWKDVPGILNADPQYFPNPVKIDYMSYREAVELTFFGAKVIHPKTIKPLENTGIPLYVRSFLKPTAKGTLIGPEHDSIKRNVPVFILKTKQVLITVSQPDFSFMDERSMERIFGIFSDLNMKINLMQHSALNLSVSIDIPEQDIMDLIETLAEQFEVRYNDGLELITIRHYTKEAIEQETTNREVYVEQKTRRIARYLVKAKRTKA